MSLSKIKQVAGKAVHIPGDDIDTDRIIPARFMKCVTFDGLGEYMFYDVRKNEDGSDTDHNLNKAEFAEASIIVSGNNFGCGSSREHAPQAIAKAGFKAIIAEGYAEIFNGNSTQLGMPCVIVSRSDRQAIAAEVEANPSIEVSIDVENLKVSVGETVYSCEMRSANQDALINGNWDPIQELLSTEEEVKAVATKLGYTKA